MALGLGRVGHVVSASQFDRRLLDTLFERAAALEGRSLTDFLLASARVAAAETISRHELLKLTPDDQRVFVEALLSPPRPTKALRVAAARYRAAQSR